MAVVLCLLNKFYGVNIRLCKLIVIRIVIRSLFDLSVYLFFLFFKLLTPCLELR